MEKLQRSFFLLKFNTKYSRIDLICFHLGFPPGLPFKLYNRNLGCAMSANIKCYVESQKEKSHRWKSVNYVLSFRSKFHTLRLCHFCWFASTVICLVCGSSPACRSYRFQAMSISISIYRQVFIPFKT